MANQVTQVSMPLHTAVKYAIGHLKAQWAGHKMATVYISGKPGGGKSESFATECSKNNIGFVPITVGLIRAERFTGIPDFKRETVDGKEVLNTEWSVPEIVCILREASAKYTNVVCLLDDWHVAPPEIQSIGFELFTYNSINGYSVPSNVGFVLAGNPSSVAGARNSFSAIMNRVCKINVETDFDHWRDQFAYKSNLNVEFVSFLDNMSNRPLFHGDEETKDPWPSPRSWTECSRAVDNLSNTDWGLSTDGIDNLTHSIINAHVGTKAAAEFMIYHTIYAHINAKKIFSTGKWKLPTDPIKKFAFGAACSAEFYDRYVKKDPSAMPIYCAMMNEFESNCPEIAIRSIRFLATKDFKIPQALIKEKVLKQETLSRLLDISKTLQ